MEYYLSVKRNGLLIHATIWITPEDYAWWKKPILKGDILYDYISTTFLKWQNYINEGQISGYEGVGAEGNKCGYKGCYGLNVCSTSIPQFVCWNPNYQCDILGGEISEVN